MGFKICMNISCRKTSTHEWKRGWLLQSGEYAQLCYTCGSAYENSVYCDTFHEQQSGWRDCLTCNKSVHCGCLASKYLFEHLDLGGIVCNNCTKSSQPQLIQTCDILNGFGPLVKNNGGNLDSTLLENRVAGITINEEKLAQLCRLMEAHESNLTSKFDGAESDGQFRKEGVNHPIREAITGFSNATQIPAGISKFIKPVSTRSVLDMRDMNGPLAQSSLSMTSPFQPGQGQRSRPILPKPSKPSFVSETSKADVHELRIARPPAEGRGKNQLLPRYWPRITDQELQQISGDLNSKIVPLFEKVLSASDAGRIGRLVLPKACAEAYFPHISQSEGLPLRVQDVKGREWTFQFRFWPNNNSRMYVLEGVTPCIQSMQLQAGDTITFSRTDPGGKLVMGFRKSTNNSTEDSQTSSAFPNGPAVAETSYSGDGGNLWNNRSMVNGDSITPEKKRARNIGPKSKRLLMHSDEALELQYTWEEAQDLLRPPPAVKPNIVTIEGYDIEEYDEPPVFGKRTIFADRSSGGQEQWAQCDNCSKWRKLPEDAFLPPKWTCSENVWDCSRSWCSAPEETGAKDLDNLFKVNRDFKKRRQKTSPEWEEGSGLDALASAAVLGEPSTTKHPRHRLGCTCIVCIQPPSGKGKHEPTCTCNVCSTVKRRFKTLMLRKKKRQSEREAENSRSETVVPDPENQNCAGQIDLNCDPNSSHLDNVALDKRNGVTSSVSGMQTNAEDMRRMSDEAFLASIGWNFNNGPE